MIFKQSWLHVTDNTNVEWLQVFHLYKGFWRKQTRVGFFVKGSARVIQPPRMEYKGYKFRFNKKGDICRGLLVRQRFSLLRPDGMRVLFADNSSILIKKKQNPKSKYILGPTTVLLRRKKFKTLFKTRL